MIDLLLVSEYCTVLYSTVQYCTDIDIRYSIDIDIGYNIGDHRTTGPQDTAHKSENTSTNSNKNW